MKPIKFITTFSKNGYEVYGKTWIESFSMFVKDNTDITADIYVDFTLEVKDDRINLIDYNQAIQHHKSWLTEFDTKYKQSRYNKKMAMRFSYKSFVMQHALNTTGCYLIWLDGDCVFKPEQDYSKFAEELLNGKFIAVQREINNGDDHCESGIVIFDTDHSDKHKFLNQFVNNYKIENIIGMTSPYDGFIIYKSLSGIDYVDLNDGYGRGGIQSDPNETFLHPEINKRFLHNIGITGKSQYEAWKIYSDSDEYFKLIKNRNVKTPDEIKSIRQKLIDIRNNVKK